MSLSSLLLSAHQKKYIVKFRHSEHWAVSKWLTRTNTNYHFLWKDTCWFASTPLHRNMVKTRGTEMGGEEVMRAKGHEGSNLAPRAPCFSRFLKTELDGSPQVVVADPVGNSPKMLKCLKMPPEETFLLLCRKRHHKRPAGVAQSHEKHLHCLAPPCNHRKSLSVG